MHSAVYNLLELRLVFNYYTFGFFFFWMPFEGNGNREEPRGGDFWAESWGMGTLLVGWCSDYST